MIEIIKPGVSRWDNLVTSRQNDSLVTKYNHKMKTTKCGCVVLDKEMKHILLVQNNYAYISGKEQWGLPKGLRENGETFAMCASRELFEETGLSIPIRDSMLKIKIMNTYYFPVILKDKIDLHTNDTDEIKSVKWFSLDNIKSIPINRETNLFITLKLDKIKKL